MPCIVGLEVELTVPDLLGMGLSMPSHLSGLEISVQRQLEAFSWKWLCWKEQIRLLRTW